MIYGLDLFSGIGGITIALEPWVRPIAYCEIDDYCRRVLISRMSEGQLPRAPIWDDIRTLPIDQLPAKPEIIYGGFPCQDISVAGVRGGMDGERSGLFFEIARLVRAIRPQYVFLENVPNITIVGLDQVAAAFAEIRYDCRWGMLSAYDMGAPHRRERWFMLANSDGERLERLELYNRPRPTQPRITNMALPESWLTANCGLVRKYYELPRPMDRIKALGNAVVPIQAREAFKRLMGLP